MLCVSVNLDLSITVKVLDLLAWKFTGTHKLIFTF